MLSFGPDAAAKPITTYFRTSITLGVDPATLRACVFGIMADDGAVVYVNGVEVGRKNMGLQSPVRFADRALAVLGDPNESNMEYFSFNPAGVLRNGTNVFAVEVHQDVVRPRRVLRAARPPPPSTQLHPDPLSHPCRPRSLHGAPRAEGIACLLLRQQVVVSDVVGGAKDWLPTPACVRGTLAPHHNAWSPAPRPPPAAVHPGPYL